jgi:hypothetical protein
MGDRRGKRGGERGRGRVKRREVESEDGWTVVTHGLARLNVNGNATAAEKVDAGALPTKMVEGLTAEKLVAELRRLQERWRDTAVAEQVKKLVGAKKWEVTKAVCIGIGSFSIDWEHRHRSMWQLVLFLDVIEHLGTDIQTYAQDPAFTPLDIQFLHLLSIITVTTGIEAHIMVASFVFSPFVDWYMLLPVFLASRHPVLYVGNEIMDDYGAYAQTKEKREKLGECNELGKKFLQVREYVKLRDFESHAHALEGMVVYWKTTAIDDELPS